jgi:hypothetical protein
MCYYFWVIFNHIAFPTQKKIANQGMQHYFTDKYPISRVNQCVDSAELPAAVGRHVERLVHTLISISLLQFNTFHDKYQTPKYIGPGGRILSESSRTKKYKAQLPKRGTVWLTRELLQRYNSEVRKSIIIKLQRCERKTM